MKEMRLARVRVWKGSTGGRAMSASLTHANSNPCFGVGEKKQNSPRERQDSPSTET